MKKVVGCIIVVSLAICGSLTWLAYGRWNGGSSFLANFLLNATAEFVGLGLTAIAGTIIAWQVAGKKLESVIGSIRQLRTDAVISGPVARTAVVLTVGMISPELLRHARSSESNGQESTGCRVCDLPVATTPKPPERCKYCGLADKFWKVSLPEQHADESCKTFGGV